MDCITTGPRTSGNYRKYGGFCSYSVAPGFAVHTMPDNFTFEEARFVNAFIYFNFILCKKVWCMNKKPFKFI